MKCLFILLLLFFIPDVSARSDKFGENFRGITANFDINGNIEVIKENKSILIQGLVKDRKTNIPISRAIFQSIEPKNKPIVKTYISRSDGTFLNHLLLDDYLLKLPFRDCIQISRQIVSGKDATTVYASTINMEHSTYNTINPAIAIDGKRNSKDSDKIPPSVFSGRSRQKKTVEKNQGNLIDSQSNEPVAFASIAILDSAYIVIKDTRTDRSGRFSFEVTGKSYAIRVSMLGYKDLINKIADLKGDSLILKLEPNDILLPEVVITAPPPAIRVNGDTLEYWMGAYTKGHEILLQDVLRNVPGIYIGQDGRLTINNKPVYKILIEGKEFFGNDMQMALKNIPSEIISKLHVYNKQSDISETMGIKEISDNQVLDLEIKDEFKKNIFGNVQAGYGSNSRYYHKFMFSSLSENNQLTIVGNINNTNNDEYGMGLESDGPGLKTSKVLGANFNTEQIRNLKIESSIMYEDATELIESNEVTENFISSGNRYTEDSSREEENKKQIKIESSFDWKTKSFFFAHLRIKGFHEDTRNNQYSELRSYVNQSDTTKEKSDYSVLGYENGWSGTLTTGFKLNDKGRNLSLQLNGGLENGLEKGVNQSIVSYNSLKNIALDQRINNKSNIYNWGGTLSYTEPIGDDIILYASYTLNYNRSKKDKSVFKRDDYNGYSIIDSIYSRQYRDYDRNQIVRLGFQSIKDKYEYFLDLNMEPIRYSSIINLGDSLIQNMKQNAANYSGSIKFVYKPQKKRLINISYSGLFNEPSTNQLSGDTTVLNQMNKVYGNTGLKVSFTNNISLQFQKTDFESGQFFMGSAGINFTTNQIVEYSKIDTRGNIETTCKNVNGNWGANLDFILNTPFKNKKFSLSNIIALSYYRNAGFVNDEKSVINNLNLHEYLTINMDVDNISSSLELEGTLNLTKNNLSTQNNKHFSNYGILNTTSIKLPYRVSLQNNIGYKYFIGYSNNSNNSEFLWSTSVSKLLLKDRGLLRFSVYDILNQKKNITNVSGSNKITDITTNSLGRYFLFSFLFRFNIKK